jgi:hypothetical protein
VKTEPGGYHKIVIPAQHWFLSHGLTIMTATYVKFKKKSAPWMFESMLVGTFSLSIMKLRRKTLVGIGMFSS